MAPETLPQVAVPMRMWGVGLSMSACHEALASAWMAVKVSYRHRQMATSFFWATASRILAVAARP